MSNPAFTCKRGDRGPSLGRCNVAGCRARAFDRCAHEKLVGACDRTICKDHAVTVGDKVYCPFHGNERLKKQSDRK